MIGEHRRGAIVLSEIHGEEAGVDDDRGAVVTGTRRGHANAVAGRGDVALAALDLGHAGLELVDGRDALGHGRLLVVGHSDHPARIRERCEEEHLCGRPQDHPQSLNYGDLGHVAVPVDDAPAGCPESSFPTGASPGVRRQLRSGVRCRVCHHERLWLVTDGLSSCLSRVRRDLARALSVGDSPKRCGCPT